jgi:hypothetical protein
MMFGFATPSRQLGGSQPGRAPVFREEHRAHLGSEERGQNLLLQWLSPHQVEQYDLCLYFEVVGSATGTRYRIRRGTAMNIEELAADGCVARRWCFAPEGALATGDVMLAQKVALETFELSALAIANHDGPRGIGFPSRSFLHMDELVWLVLAFASFATLVWSFFQIAF